MKSILILFMSFTVPPIVYSQEPKHIPVQDSLAIKTKSVDTELFHPYSGLLFPTSIKTDSVYLRGFLSQSLTSPLPSLSSQLQQNLSITSTWKNELLKQEEYKTLRTIIGSVEMGGVAYLAYLHMKKYGLK